jgi:hypothetical protein
MYAHRIPALAVFGSTLLALLPSLSNTQDQAGAGRPRGIEVSSLAPEKNAQLSSLIAEIRSQTDAFVFLSGGASTERRSTPLRTRPSSSGFLRATLWRPRKAF